MPCVYVTRIWDRLHWQLSVRSRKRSSTRYLRMQTYVSLQQRCLPTSPLFRSLHSRLSAIGCSGISLAVRDTEGSLTCIPSKWDTLSWARVSAWGSGTLEPDFQTTPVSVHATCSFSLVAHQNFKPTFFSIPFGVSVFSLTGHFQSGKLRRSQTFTSCFLPVIRDLFYESDLTQWSFFMPMRQRHWTIRMFDSTLLYALWIFHVFWPCMWILKWDTKKNSVKKRTSLILSLCVCLSEKESTWSILSSCLKSPLLSS